MKLYGILFSRFWNEISICQTFDKHWVAKKAANNLQLLNLNEQDFRFSIFLFFIYNTMLGFVS